MSNTAHFFDIDCLIDFEQQAWIIDKRNPNLPLLKIPISEFNLIKGGIYYKKGNKIEFNGSVYYLPDNIWNKLKIMAAKSGNNFSNYAISLQEFLNKDIINDKKIDLTLEVILKLKNKMDDFYILCSKQTKSNYEKVIEKLIDELKKNGIIVKNFYYLNDTLYNISNDANEFKKLRLLIQHLIGYKSDGNKFSDEEITKYDSVNLYDKNIDLLNFSKNAKDLLNIMISNTDKGLKDVIKDDLKYDIPNIYFHKISDNYYNPMLTKKVDLNLGFLIKSFESFKRF